MPDQQPCFGSVNVVLPMIRLWIMCVGVSCTHVLLTELRFALILRGFLRARIGRTVPTSVRHMPVFGEA